MAGSGGVSGIDNGIEKRRREKRKPGPHLSLPWRNAAWLEMKHDGAGERLDAQAWKARWQKASTLNSSALASSGGMAGIAGWRKPMAIAGNLAHYLLKVA